jgi:hypothetical protein
VLLRPCQLHPRQPWHASRSWAHPPPLAPRPALSALSLLYVRCLPLVPRPSPHAPSSCTSTIMEDPRPLARWCTLDGGGPSPEGCFLVASHHLVCLFVCSPVGCCCHDVLSEHVRCHCSGPVCRYVPGCVGVSGNSQKRHHSNPRLPTSVLTGSAERRLQYAPYLLIFICFLWRVSRCVRW